MLTDSYKVNHLELRNLNPDLDDLSNYLSWMTDEENKFIESVRPHWSIQELKNFVKTCNASETVVFLGIFDGDNHIGNIKIDQINIVAKSAWIGILVGSCSHRGIGIGSAVISQTMKIFHENFQIDNFFLGVDKQNLAAIKSYEKSGFSYYEKHKKLGAIIMHKKESGLLK